MTHFGRIERVQELAAQQPHLLARTVELGRALRAAPERHHALERALRHRYETELRAHGSQLPSEAIHALLEQDIELNAQGLDRETG